MVKPAQADSANARGDALLIALFVMAGVWLRSLAVAKPPWVDECYSLAEATTDIGKLAASDQAPFFYWYLGLGGTPSLLSARFMVLALTSFNIVALMMLSRRWGRTSLVLTGMLSISLPFFLRYGTELRCYGALITFTALALWSLDEFLERGGHRGWYALLLFSVVMCPLTHAIGVFVAAAVLVTLYLLCRTRGRSLPSFGLLVPLFVLPCLALLSWLLAFHMTEKVQHVDWISKPTPLYVAKELAGLILGTVRDGADAFGTPFVLVVGISGLGILVAGAALLPPRRESGAYLWGAFSYFLQILAVSICLRPVLIARTMVPMLPFLILFTAAGLAALGERRKRIVVGCLTIFAALSVVRWVVWEGKAEKEAWYAAVGQVMALRSTEYPLYHHVRFQPIFDYYFRNRIKPEEVSHYAQGSRVSDFPLGDFELLLTPNRIGLIPELWTALQSNYDMELLYGDKIVLLYRCRYKKSL